MNHSGTQTALLECLRAEIVAHRSERPLVERLPDPLDNALAQQDTRRIADERDREAEMLHKIDAALEAIRTGEYGICVDCGGYIAPKRLIAVPWAVTCRKCAEAWERRAERMVTE